MKTLSKTPSLKIDQEQEYSRVISNMLTDVYVMESAFVRTRKAVSKNGEEKERTKQQITDVICEEGYRKVEEAAISVLSAAVTEEKDRHVILAEIRQLLVPLYTNVFMKKREIAMASCCLRAIVAPAQEVWMEWKLSTGGYSDRAGSESGAVEARDEIWLSHVVARQRSTGYLLV